MRKIVDSDLVGKTIKSIDNSCANVLELHFTDGTFIRLWAEDVVQTPYGNIPGILVEEGYLFGGGTHE